MKIAVKISGLALLAFAGIGTLAGGVFLRVWEQEYRDGIQGQVEVFAEIFFDEMRRLEAQQGTNAFDLRTASSMLSETCQRMFALPISRKLMLTHITAFDLEGTIVADARWEKLGQPVADEVIRNNIGWRKLMVVDHAEAIHFFFPLLDTNNVDSGSLDIGVSKRLFQAASAQASKRIAAIFAVMSACLVACIYALCHVLISKPMNYLADVSRSMTEGQFLTSIHFVKHRDEFARLSRSLLDISAYFQEMTELAQQISTGSLTGQQVRKRSKRDVLGVALQEMLAYLQTVAAGADRIAEGDVRIVIPLRTDTDVLGRALHRMMSYLNDMADTATLISSGDLRSRVTPRSDRDMLGTAFANITTYLHTLADSATAIAEGDLTQRVQPQSPYDILGNAFARMAGQLRESFDHIRQEMAERIQAQDALQRLNEELEMRVGERTAEITRQKYILDMFMENVPDSIYFKDRDSRITHTSHAHARSMGFQTPAELVGKTDFDFFSKEQALRKYEQEQAIIRSGQPLLAIEEPDAGGRWSLTTKMPLRDEHGAIIGTFGISRDITPLKIAQHQVEEAYAEIQMLNEQLHQENRRMGAELDVARRLQQMVLPKSEELAQIPGVEIVGYMQPAEEVGGDYYDVLRYDDGLCIGIGDVTGHGLESGMLMLMTQTAIRTMIDRGETDPAIFLNTINRVLYHNIQRMGVDRSLTLLMMNYRRGHLRLFGQHEDVLVVRHDGRIERIDTLDLGFPVGMVDDIRQWISEAAITLDSGDGVVLYTDGITEAQNPAKEFYGLERLCRVISANWRDTTVDGLKEALLDDIRTFVCGAAMYDDITFVVLKQQ